MYWKCTYLKYLPWQTRFLFNFLVNQMMEIFRLSQTWRAPSYVPMTSLQQSVFCSSFSLIHPTPKPFCVCAKALLLQPSIVKGLFVWCPSRLGPLQHAARAQSTCSSLSKFNSTQTRLFPGQWATNPCLGAMTTPSVITVSKHLLLRHLSHANSTQFALIHRPYSEKYDARVFYFIIF